MYSVTVEMIGIMSNYQMKILQTNQIVFIWFLFCGARNETFGNIFILNCIY